MRRLFAVLWLVLSLVGLPTVRAEGADYGTPGGFALPWERGQSYRVTWDPQGHWDEGKASGIAWDFAMPEGIAVLAPLTGRAVFGTDTRPLETTYGNYVDITDEAGYWLVRLAHLQEEQSGARYVRAGEQLAHSGASGFVSPHLHMELFVREGAEWVKPDLDRLSTLCGIPVAELAVDAYVVREGYQDPLALVGPAEVDEPTIALGQTTAMRFSFINNSDSPVNLEVIQVWLYSLDGDSLLAEADGAWTVAAEGQTEVVVPVRPSAAGSWYVGRVTWRSETRSGGLPARGQLQVSPSPLSLVGWSGPPSDLSVGNSPALQVWVENASDASVAVDDLVLEGTRPDGTAWKASSDEDVLWQPGEFRSVTLAPSEPFWQTGYWSVERLSYLKDGKAFDIARMSETLAVYGPQVQVSDIALYRAPEGARVLLRIENVGTDVASIDAVEIRGVTWDGDSVAGYLGAIAPLSPGQGALLQVSMPLSTGEALPVLAEAGYWVRGELVAMRLPGQPAGTPATTEGSPGTVSGVPVVNPLRIVR